MPPVLLLDLDNTAYAYRPCHEAGLDRAEQRAMALNPLWEEPGRLRRGYSQARDAVKRRLRGTAASHCRLLYFKTLVEDEFGRSDPAVVLALHQSYWAAFMETMRPEPDCRSVLLAARDRGFRLAWVTNFTTERQLLKLQTLNLTDVADLVVTSEEVGFDKPRPEIVRHTLGLLGAEASDVWLIGDDRIDDGELAESLGLRFVWFDRGEDEAVREGIPYRIRSWSELQAILP